MVAIVVKETIQGGVPEPARRREAVVARGFCGTDVFRKCPGVSSGPVQNVGDTVGDGNRTKN